MGNPFIRRFREVAGSGLPALLNVLELRPPDPEVVAGLWRAVWCYLVTPFRAVAPEGIAELMALAAVASLVAILARLYGLRRVVYLSLLALWALLIFSLALYLLGM